MQTNHETVQSQPAEQSAMPVAYLKRSFFSWAFQCIHTFISIIGVIPERTTWLRALFMGASFAFLFFVLQANKNFNWAIVYFTTGLVAYMVFLLLVLPEHGLRLWFIKKFGEERAYRVYEGILAFIFFHNGTSIGFMSESTVNSGFWGDLPQFLVMVIAAAVFSLGFVVKLWSTMLIGVPVYYWKDIFVGHKVSEFVVAGPYRFFSNPIYGVGHLTGYGVAIYNNSIYGIAASAINQACVFLFYFLIEKPFIVRTYLTPDQEKI